jgi:hypothetical protein
MSCLIVIFEAIISHIHHIYIASPLLKKKLGYKLFAINLYFNSSQYYPTLDNTLAMKSFSRECMLTVDASDVGVGAELQFIFKTLTKISKNNPQLKKK